MKILAALLLTLSLPLPDSAQVIVDHVDVIEFNQYTPDRLDSPSIVQMIFWDFSPLHGEFRVVDWRKWDKLAQRPTYNYKTKRYELLFWDSNSDLFRRVTSMSYKETRTRRDPEAVNRKKFLPAYRRKLFEPHKASWRYP
tara:strand:+ start:260 stop:679 length:420 start_codon:yes stop_codon:yes gene_type:complete